MNFFNLYFSEKLNEIEIALRSQTSTVLGRILNLKNDVISEKQSQIEKLENRLSEEQDSITETNKVRMFEAVFGAISLQLITYLIGVGKNIRPLVDVVIFL